MGGKMTTKINDDLSEPTSRQKLSEQEKRDYYRQWESSGMSKSKFCKAHRLSASEFYYWCKLFKPKTVIDDANAFSPVVAKTAPLQTEVAQLEMKLPNETRLFITLPERQLISFIQELCHAVTIIR